MKCRIVIRIYLYFNPMIKGQALGPHRTELNVTMSL